MSRLTRQRHSHCPSHRLRRWIYKDDYTWRSGKLTQRAQQQQALDAKICEQRYIKVNAIHYEYRTKEQPPNSGDRSVPWIQMKGHWLQQAGFDIDTPVTVRVMDGCLVLTTEQ